MSIHAYSRLFFLASSQHPLNLTDPTPGLSMFPSKTLRKLSSSWSLPHVCDSMAYGGMLLWNSSSFPVLTLISRIMRSCGGEHGRSRTLEARRGRDEIGRNDRARYTARGGNQLLKHPAEILDIVLSVAFGGGVSKWVQHGQG